MNDIMADISTKLRVRIVNACEEFPEEVDFVTHSPSVVHRLVAAYSAYCSGDPVEVFINGEKALTHSDWGLVEPPKGV